MKKKKNKVKEYLPLYLMMLPGLLYLPVSYTHLTLPTT